VIWISFPKRWRKIRSSSFSLFFVFLILFLSRVVRFRDEGRVKFFLKVGLIIMRMCVYLCVTFRIISDRFGNISVGRGQGGGAAVLLVYGIAEEVRVLSRFSYADDV